MMDATRGNPGGGDRPGWYGDLVDYLSDGRIPALVMMVNRRGLDARREPLLRQLLDSNKWIIIRYLEKVLNEDFLEDTLSALSMVKGMGVDWPELDSFLDDNKHKLVRSLLELLASKDPDSSLYAWQDIQQLRRAGVDWPQLATMERSIDSDFKSRQLDEMWVSDLRKDDKFNLDSMMRSLERRNYRDATGWMREIGSSVGSRDVPVDGVDTKAIDAHHDGMVREMLRVLKDPIAAGFLDDLDAEIMVRGAERLGLRWPELAIMRKSLDADVDKLALEAWTGNMATRKLQKAADKGFDDLRRYGSRWITSLRDDLHRAGANGAMVADIFNMNKDRLLYVIGRDLGTVKDMHAALAGIHQCIAATGSTWPETRELVSRNIGNIRKWFDWYLNSYHADAVPGAFSLLQGVGIDPATLKELKKDAVDRMLKKVKEFIKQFGFNRMSLNGLEALEKMGVKVNMQDPRTQARMEADLANKLVAVGLSRESLEVVSLILRYGGDGARARLAKLMNDNKVPIMRGMLLLIKGNNMYSVIPPYTALRKLGMDWPDLEIIRDTLEKDIGPHAIAEMRGGGARMIADHIARKMAAQMAAGDDTGVGYTMQGLDRIDRDVASAALEPISDDIAAWARHLVHDRGSPSFAVHELARLASYTNGLDPKVLRALDDARDPIIKDILTLVRDQHEEEAARLVGKLRFMGAEWPQLRVISGSLLEDDEDDYGSAWRARIEAEEYVSALVHDLRHADNWGIVALDLKEIGELDVELSLPSSTRALIAKNRHTIIRSILNDIAEHPGSTRMLKAVLALNNLGFNWPELSTIHDSLSATGKRGKVAENRVNPQAAVDTWFKRFMRQISSDEQDYEEAMWSLIMMGRFDAPISADIDTIRIDRNKEFILRAMLKALANKMDMGLHVADFEQREMLAGARKLGLDWPELDTMERSLRADRQVDESNDEHDEYLGQLMMYLKSYLLDRRYGAMFEVIQEIAAMDGVPHDLKPLLDSNKHGILKRMLEFIKHATSGRYVSPEMAGFDALSTLDGLRNLGVDWPELKHVRRSLRADRG